MQTGRHLVRVAAAGVHSIHFVSVNMLKQFLAQLICSTVRRSTGQDMHIFQTLLHLTEDKTEKKIRYGLQSILINNNA